MGRSIRSVRQEVNGLAERWERAARGLSRDNAVPARRMVQRAKVHASEVFPSFSDAAEAAAFSVLVEALRTEPEE